MPVSTAVRLQLLVALAFAVAPVLLLLNAREGSALQTLGLVAAFTGWPVAMVVFGTQLRYWWRRGRKRH